ncbi:unnamed protein product, partial [Pylaiella littoralis]
MDSPSRGGSASSKLLTAQLLDASTSRHEDFSARIADNPDDERISHALPEDHDEASSPGEGGGGEGERTGKGGSTDDNERKAKGNGSSSSSNLMMRNTSSVESILGSMSRGSTIRATAPWKLTRAVVHVEDAWKGRFSPCPPLEKKEAVEVAIFKLRWKYRSLEFFVVHLLLSLSLVETPSWCVATGRCFWSCYPDFSRNFHMPQWQAMVIEGVLLLALVAIALCDVRACGSDYWSGSRKSQYQSMWFKHAAIVGYVTVFLLSIAVDDRVHTLSGYGRILLYFCVHRRTVLVVTQLRHILGAVAEIWVLIFLNILLFAWVGVILYAGTDEGDLMFPNLFEACWRLFVLFTTTNFPAIMMTALDQVRAAIIYFAGFVIINVFFLAPLSLAFIFNVFRGGQSGIPRMEEEIRLRSTVAAFTLLDDEGLGHISQANIGAFLLEVHSMRGIASREITRLQDLIDEAGARTPEKAPSLVLSDFKDAVSVMDRSAQHAEWITEVQWYYPNLYQSPGFRRLTWIVKHKHATVWPGFGGTPRVSIQVMDAVDTGMLVVSFIALILARSFESADEWSAQKDWSQVCVVLGFCVTVGLRAVVRGWHNCVQRPTWVFNAIVTLLSVSTLFLALTVDDCLWGWRIMRVLRVIHMALVLAFVPRLSFYIRTLLIMTKRAATPASVLLAWSFFMATLGTQLFGGLVCLPTLAVGDETCHGITVPTNNYTMNGLELLNFNDVPTSLVTLLVLFVVNDWHVIVDEFVDVSGTGWARSYFILNYIMGVAVILNLVVTVVINSFWDEFKRTNKPALALRQLHDAAAASARHRPATLTRDGGSASRSSSVSSASAAASAAVAAAAAAAAAAYGLGAGCDTGVGTGTGTGRGSFRRGRDGAGAGRGMATVCDDAVFGAGVGGGDGNGNGNGAALLLPGADVDVDVGIGVGAGAGAGAGTPSPQGEIGWGWRGVSTEEDDEEAVVPTSSTPARRGSRDLGSAGGVYSGGGNDHGQQQQQQQQALPNGDEADMNAERSMARRA